MSLPQTRPRSCRSGAAYLTLITIEGASRAAKKTQSNVEGPGGNRLRIRLARRRRYLTPADRDRLDVGGHDERDRDGDGERRGSGVTPLSAAARSAPPKPRGRNHLVL